MRYLSTVWLYIEGGKSIIFASNRFILEIPVDNIHKSLDNSLNILQDSKINVLSDRQTINLRTDLEVKTDERKNELPQRVQ